jgi:hypothetical protein
MKKGRPKEVPVESFTKPVKFTKEFNNADGTKAVWKYDTSVTSYGPISVEIIYPKNTEVKEELDLTSEKIKKTKRLYLNEANGKLVKYTRAKELGIIK